MEISILQDIINVLNLVNDNEKVPSSPEEIIKFVRQAANSVEPIFQRFQPETQGYLEDVKTAVRRRSATPMPPPITIQVGNAPTSTSSALVSNDSGEEVDEIPDGIECTQTQESYTLDYLVDRMRKYDIRRPRFQRKFVWSKNRQQMLINSILMNFPIPEIMLAYQQRGDSKVIIDGMQRVSTVLGFVDDEITIGNITGNSALADFTPFQGKVFSELPLKLRRRFLSYKFTAKEIMSPHEYWPAIFDRLNTGSQKMSNGEQLRSWFDGQPCSPFLEIVEEITEENPQFLEMFGKNDRYGGLYQVVRSYAMHCSWDTYDKPVKKFVHGFLNENKSKWSSNAKLARLRKDITNAILLIHGAFEDRNTGSARNAFRLEDKAQVNAGLIDCIFHAMFLIQESELEEQNDLRTIGKMLTGLKTAIKQDEKGVKLALKQDTSSRESVHDRMRFVEAEINRKIKYRERRAEQSLAPSRR